MLGDVTCRAIEAHELPAWILDGPRGGLDPAFGAALGANAKLVGGRLFWRETLDQRQDPGDILGVHIDGQRIGGRQHLGHRVASDRGKTVREPFQDERALDDPKGKRVIRDGVTDHAIAFFTLAQGGLVPLARSNVTREAQTLR